MNRATRPAAQELSGPPVDIFREEENLLVAISLPGLKASDFRIALVGERQLQIEGTVPYRYPVPQDRLHQAERAFGPFSRTLDLPLPVDGQRAEIAYANGLLTVRMPIRFQPLSIQWAPPGR